MVKRQKQKQKAFTLIEVLVATFLISIIFLGIFGGFQLVIKVVSQTKMKISAVFIAAQKIEEIRGLSFEEIQTREETVIVGNVSFNIQIIVEDFDDCLDGTIEGLDCEGDAVATDVIPNDYKRVKALVSWEEAWGGEMNLNTIVAQKGVEIGEGKGALRLTISTSLGQLLDIGSSDRLPPCPETSIQLINEELGTSQCFGTASGNLGIRLLTLDQSAEPDDYKIIVSKQGYSREETFRSGDVYNSSVITTPFRKNPTIKEGQLYPITLKIDQLGNLNITTVAPWGGDSFFDSFFNEDKIFEKNQLRISGNEVVLATSSPATYFSDGYLISESVEPSSITAWHELSWSDFEELETVLKYQLFYATSTEWFLLPDSALSGNSVGFTVSPIELSDLSISDFPKLRIKANFSTSNLLKTPILYDWRLSWKDGQASPISNVGFSLRGEKIVGQDSQEDPIYKYSSATYSGADGTKVFSGIEPDNYLFSNFNKGGIALDLNTGLSPMPLSVAPGASETYLLYLESGNSLFVKIKDAANDEPIFGVSVKLSSASLDYQETQTSNNDGETLFVLLDGAGDYYLEIEAENYESAAYNLSIWTDGLKYVSLERYE